MCLFFSSRGVQITHEGECLQFINAFEISAKDAVPMEVENVNYYVLKTLSHNFASLSSPLSQQPFRNSIYYTYIEN